MAKVIDYFKENCSNFIYIFIADDAARKVFGNAPVILQKRKNQIQYVITAAQMSKYTYEQLKSVIAEEIIRVYGKTPGAVLLDLAEGRNVYSKNVVRKPISISGTPRCGAGITSDGYPIGVDTNNYVQVANTENGMPIGTFDLSTGEQVSYFNGSSWIAGDTPTSDVNSKNLWTNNINWNQVLNLLISLIGFLFGVKKAKNMGAYQSDGWYGVTKNTTQYRNPGNDWLPVALLAVAGYMLVTTNDDK